jgi:hypothetical protein
MHFSPPSLHPRVLLSPEHKTAAGREFASFVGEQRLEKLAAAPALDTLKIPLTTVSLNSNFDAYINIWYRGADAASAVPLMVDSGNSMLIVPRWEAIAALPNWKANYQVLGTSPEPWGCPANVVLGPVGLVAASGHLLEIPDCVFYACTGDCPKDGSRTAIFGAGCVSPWTANGWNTPSNVNVTMQAPLSYNSPYLFAEIDYAAAATIYGAANTPKIASGSYLNLSKTRPSGYKIFDIIPDLAWMALTAKALTIGNVKTAWPGTVPSPIAMIDTGGGPVFLSDPNGYVYRNRWPDPVGNPDWASDSVDCQSTSEDVSIELGDRPNSFSYKIDPSHLPATVQGLTLVMCKLNSYMRGQQGMNIGGISALANYILIDYKNKQVGFKPK